ncbi:hypothetical protein [uncultured Paludibaculum sp.]|uniref:hypothetical protein n=1 Tax=uncultured Paludibaculum sp. TaxID=1765020 RepID=UPI002AAB9359|nr:hypothetical protein [uncultured Paludibaculum sp.]
MIPLAVEASGLTECHGQAVPNGDRLGADIHLVDQQADYPLPFPNIHRFRPQPQSSLKWSQALDHVQITLLIGHGRFNRL